MAKKKEAGTGSAPSALAQLEPRMRAAVVEEVFDAFCDELDAFNAVYADSAAAAGLRRVAERLGVPYLVLHTVSTEHYGHQEEADGKGAAELKRRDVQEWGAWCKEHAPERLEVANG